MQRILLLRCFVTNIVTTYTQQLLTEPLNREARTDQAQNYKKQEIIEINQRLPEQLIMDEQSNPKFTFAPAAKRVGFVRNYWYQNTLHLYSHYHENQVIFMIFMGNILHKHSLCKWKLRQWIHSFLFYKNVVFPAQAEYSYFSADFRLKTFLYYS